MPAEKEAGRSRRQAAEKSARRERTRRAGSLHRPRTLSPVAGRLETSRQHLHLRWRFGHESRTGRHHPPIPHALVSGGTAFTA